MGETRGEKDDAGKKDGERRAVREQGATGILERRQGVHMALIKTHRQGWAIALTVVEFLALGLVPGVPALPYLADQALQRVVLFALVAAFVALLGGARALAPTMTGVRRALREGRYPVVLALALGVLEAASLLQAAAAGEPVPLSPTWAADLLGTVALCAAVGLYEEALFRVLLLGGLLSCHGGTRNGVLVSVLVSSLAFGAAHVALVGSIDVLTLAQMVLKTAQTACIGLLLGAVYVRTRSFLGVAALHGLADLLLMAPLAVMGGIEGSIGDYVSGGGVGLAALASALALVAIYVVMVALYAPAAVQAWRLLASAPVPAAGPFAEGWEPRAEEARPSADDDRPVRPTGL